MESRSSSVDQSPPLSASSTADWESDLESDSESEWELEFEFELELDLAETAATANMMKTTRVAITKSLERLERAIVFLLF